MTSRRSNLYHIFRSFFLFGVLMPKGVEKLSGQYLFLICDESLTCRILNSNLGHFSRFTFIILSV
jgi:hypothetical protein